MGQFKMEDFTMPHLSHCIEITALFRIKTVKFCMELTCKVIIGPCKIKDIQKIQTKSQQELCLRRTFQECSHTVHIYNFLLAPLNSHQLKVSLTDSSHVLAKAGNKNILFWQSRSRNQQNGGLDNKREEKFIIKLPTTLTDLLLKSLKHKALLLKICSIRIELALTQYRRGPRLAFVPLL